VGSIRHRSRSPLRSNCWGVLYGRAASRRPGDPATHIQAKPQFRPRLSGLRHWCCAVRWPALHLRVAYFGQHPHATVLAEISPLARSKPATGWNQRSPRTFALTAGCLTPSHRRCGMAAPAAPPALGPFFWITRRIERASGPGSPKPTSQAGRARSDRTLGGATKEAAN
jgi:hypothetical protein